MAERKGKPSAPVQQISLPPAADQALRSWLAGAKAEQESNAATERRWQGVQ